MSLRAGYRQISLSEKILLPAEIYAEHKYLTLMLKGHSLKELAGFINDATEVFLNYIPERVIICF